MSSTGGPRKNTTKKRAANAWPMKPKYKKYRGVSNYQNTLTRPRPQLKVCDLFTATPTVITNTPTIQSIFSLITGSAQQAQVQGSTVNIHKVNARYALFNASNTLTGGSGGTGVMGGAINYRIMIVYDRQCNGNTPAASDILQAVSLTSFINTFNKDRFIILSDEYGTTSGCGPQGAFHKISVSVKQQAVFSNNTTTNQIPNSGGLFAMLFSDSGDDAGLYYTATWRTRYTNC